MNRFENIGAEQVAKSQQGVLDRLSKEGGVCCSHRFDGMGGDDPPRYHEYKPGGDYSLELAEAGYMLKRFPAVLDAERLRPYEWRIEVPIGLKGGTLFLGRHLFDALAARVS